MPPRPYTATEAARLRVLTGTLARQIEDLERLVPKPAPARRKRWFGANKLERIVDAMEIAAFGRRLTPLPTVPGGRPTARWRPEDPDDPNDVEGWATPRRLIYA